MKIMKINMMLALLLSGSAFYVSSVVCAAEEYTSGSDDELGYDGELDTEVYVDAEQSHLSRMADRAVTGFDNLMIKAPVVGSRYKHHLNGAKASSVWAKGQEVSRKDLPEGVEKSGAIVIGGMQYSIGSLVVDGKAVSYLRDENDRLFEYKSVEVPAITARPKTTRAVTVTAGAAILGVAYKAIKAIGGKLFSSKEEVVDADNGEEEDTDVVSTENDKAKADADAEQARVEAAAKAKRAQEELAKREAQARVEAESKAINGFFAKCTPAQQAQVKRQLSIVERHAQRNGLKVTVTLDTIAAAMYGKVNPNAQQRRARR